MASCNELFKFTSVDEGGRRNEVVVYDDGTYKSQYLKCMSQWKLEDGELYYRHMEDVDEGDEEWYRCSDRSTFKPLFMENMSRLAEEVLLGEEG